jgi:O-antigen ligase
MVAQHAPGTSARHAPPARVRFVQGLLVAALAWGAFAFGAVYPWAHWPMAVALVIASAASLASAPAAAAAPELRWLSAAFCLFAAGALLQIVPLPLSVLPSVSAHALDVVSQFDLAVASGGAAGHAISVSPAMTVSGIALFTTFAVVVIGTSRLVSIRGPRGLAEALTVIGLLLAVTGIVQKPLFTGRIYGFWMPYGGGNPFGPFVNKNHFAGWMLMALPLTIGLLCAGVARGTPGMRGWRNRAIWLSSPAASRMVLLAAAAIVMALSLVLTMSRSGIGAMTLALAVTALVILRRQRTWGAKTLSLAYLGAVVLAIFVWVGTDALITRFASLHWDELSGRRAIWTDTLAIAARFPLTGTGLNTYGVAMLFYQKHDLAFHYDQAHNDYLQLLTEGGALLTIPALVCAGAFVVLVRRRFKEETSTTSYWLRVGAVTGIAAIALQETVDFSLQMPGNAALFAVICAIAIHKAEPRHPGARSEASRPADPAAIHTSSR